MIPERWNRLQALFSELVEGSPERRAERVAEAKLGPESAAELAELLAEHDRDRPLALEGRLRESAPGGFIAGKRLGPYELVEPLGRGGMGEVWLAERDEAGFRRRVAIKRIRRGLESEELLGRFRVERQALARLAHRSIARLLDAGLDDEGVPFLVLEHVAGRPVTQAADELHLAIDQRLALFEEICHAVAYAHAHLVVHRDLKPANILRTAEGEVRLLDFGIAKLLDPSAEGDAPATRTRALLATPEYASPEQVNGEAITTATDVHALGALLHELLTGRRPFAAHESSDIALARAIAEVEPPSPSAVAATGEADDLAARAAVRRATPKELVRALRGDLDTIVETALRKDPARRYASVERLAEDVARFRSGRTIRARADSAGYRLRKFVGRHRAAVVASTVALLLLGALVVQVFRQSAIAARERDLARAERDTATEVTEFLVKLFEADPYAADAAARDRTTLGEFLVASEAAVRRDLADRPELSARLLMLLARLSANLGRLDPALALAREAVAERRRLLGGAHPDLAESLNILATTLQERGDYTGAESAFREALEIRTRALGRRHEETAESVNNLAVLLSHVGEKSSWPEAERLEREGLELRRAIFGNDHLETAQSLNNLGAFLVGRDGPGDATAAAKLFEEALAIRSRRLGNDHPSVATTRNNLASVLRDQGRLEEAERLYREAIRGWSASLGPNHPRVSVGHWGLHRVLVARGRIEEALGAVRRSYEIDAASLPADHPYLLEERAKIAELERRLARNGGGSR